MDNSGRVLLNEFREVINGKKISEEMSFDVMIKKQGNYHRDKTKKMKTLDQLIESTGLNKEILE